MPGTRRQIPSSVNSFIGRETEKAALLQMLGQGSGARLVTVTGAGGVGKTRLVLEALRGLDDQFADGIWIVELATLRTGSEIAPRIAAVLGVEANVAEETLEVLIKFIAAREMLLVLDNCEHLTDELAVVVNTLLLQTTRLRVLCTSREAIHLPGEYRVTIQPMETPWPGTKGAPASILAASAIRLFQERAAAVAPGFVVTEENIGAVADICRTLDGIPLAIELAAAQMRVFTPAEIATRLKADLSFLTNGRANLERHNTLEAAIAWSEHLLEPSELLLLHRMSIFANSARFSAIQATCADGLLPASVILPALTRLVDKSLVFTEPAGEHMRFGMLGTIKRVALAGLAARGEQAEMARRHAQWVAQFAREGGAGVFTPDSLEWVQRLEVEFENLRMAVAFGLEHDPDLAAGIVSDLAWFWFWRDHLGEVSGWTHAVLGRQDDAVSGGVRARMLYTEGMSRAGSHDYPAALAALEEALGLANAAEDATFASVVKELYASVAVYGGMPELAERLLNEIDARGVPKEQPHLAINHELWRGLIARAYGNIAAAQRLIDEAQRRLRAFGEPFLLCLGLNEAARTCHINDDMRRAETLYRECHELALRTQNAPLLTLSFFGIAEICQLAGNLREALDWFEAGLEYLKGLGKEPTAATVLSLAYIAGGAGLHAVSVSLYSAASIPWPLEETLSAVVDHPYRQQFIRSHGLLGDTEFRRAVREGGYWSLQDALEQGLAKLHASFVDGDRTTSPELQMRLLGAGQVLLNGRRLEMADWKYALARDLLFYLITVGERTREQIVLDFWPDVNAARARNRLNVTVHFLRRALGARQWVVFEHNRYRFDPVGPYSCDVDDFYASTALAARVAPSQPAQAIASLEYAISLVRGEFLEDVIDGEWHEPLRRAIHKDVYESLLTLANLQIECGLAQNAVYTLSLAMRSEPYSEETYCTLMRAHRLRRDVVQVMQVYRHLSEVLEEEFGVSPTPETATLYQSIVLALREEAIADGQSLDDAGNNLDRAFESRTLRPQPRRRHDKT